MPPALASNAALNEVDMPVRTNHHGVWNEVVVLIHIIALLS
jgi:hypothetical protein